MAGPGQENIRREWLEKDYYKALGVPKGCQGCRHQEGVPQARARAAPGCEPGQQEGRGALQGSVRAYDVSVTPNNARTTTRPARLYGSGGGRSAGCRASVVGGGPQSGTWARRLTISATCSAAEVNPAAGLLLTYSVGCSTAVAALVLASRAEGSDIEAKSRSGSTMRCTE